MSSTRRGLHGSLRSTDGFGLLLASLLHECILHTRQLPKYTMHSIHPALMICNTLDDDEAVLFVLLFRRMYTQYTCTHAYISRSNVHGVCHPVGSDICLSVDPKTAGAPLHRHRAAARQPVRAVQVQRGVPHAAPRRLHRAADAAGALPTLTLGALCGYSRCPIPQSGCTLVALWGPS